ncbi:hypothetical protein C8R44DRAFT_815697 [Mycena epipterygia]|nr:hypothetical protein C8R44DRAFT_815697 [Mycena epipterygia]
MLASCTTPTHTLPPCINSDITSSFFNTAWYGGVPATSTTGTDNVPGATRGGSFGGGTVNETLTMYLFHSDALIFTIHGQPLMLALPNQSPLHFDSYAETMRFESVCSGTATYIDLITYTCSSDQTTAHNFWFTLHMSVFEGLAANISALVLAGDCSQ